MHCRDDLMMSGELLETYGPKHWLRNRLQNPRKGHPLLWEIGTSVGHPHWINWPNTIVVSWVYVVSSVTRQILALWWSSQGKKIMSLDSTIPNLLLRPRQLSSLSPGWILSLSQNSTITCNWNIKLTLSRWINDDPILIDRDHDILFFISFCYMYLLVSKLIRVGYSLYLLLHAREVCILKIIPWVLFLFSSLSRRCLGGPY